MKKRLFVMLAVAVLMLASCATATAAPTHGYWDRDTFVIEYFGLRIDVPRNWITRSREDWRLPLRAEITAEEVTAYATESSLEAEVVFEAFRYDTERGLSVGFSRAVLMTVLWYPELYVQQGFTRIGALYWHYSDAHIDGQPSKRTYVRRDGDFVKVITIFYDSDEELNDILALIRAY